MKTLLVAVNSRYDHEGLAVWYLKAACEKKNIPVIVKQYTINDSLERIWSSILDINPDTVAFSCYIWNRRLILDLVEDLNKVRPGTAVIIGGPETYYEGAEDDYYAAGADIVIKGEGENKLPLVLETLKKEGLESAKKLVEDQEANTCLSEYISPFCSEYLKRIKGRIAYIESSRGCPYRCSYCLSSESRKLVFFPIDKIEKDVDALVKAGAKVVKFIDRSFNVHEEHSLKIWEIIRKYEGHNVSFHFEINPDRLTEAQMSSLMTMPPGLVQVEAGIQSVNTETLRSVSRVMDVDVAIENLKILAKKGNIHIHTDLIAGLPYEDIDSFINSFNRVYEINAHHLQLGFLKLLHGTRIRREANLHDYKYRSYPPYEVLENKYMKYSDILRLKRVEEALDRTYNSGRFTLTLKYLLNYFPAPFDLYESFAQYLAEKGMIFAPIAAARLFKALRNFALNIPGMDSYALDSYIALDYASSLKNTVLPDFLSNSQVKVLNAKEYLSYYVEGQWKKTYHRRFMLLSGSFPEKKGENFMESSNRMLVDMAFIDPVTDRALIKPFDGSLPDE